MKNTNYNKEQVFISFRGRDERYGFLTHLKEKLVDGKVNVFTDDNLTGQPLENLFGHIQKSKIAIVIFSKNYAESDWCWDELVEIKKCYGTQQLTVIPIFHKVKVSHVKKQSGKFGEKFLVLQNSLLAEEVDKKKIKRIKSRIKRWKKALKIVTGIAGLTYTKNTLENEFVKKIIEKVNMNIARIAAEDGRNNADPETSETSLGYQLNQITVNVNQLNLNILHRRSRSYEAPSLSQNPEGYNENSDLKPISGAFKRSASYLEDAKLLGPYAFEAIRCQKPVKNKQSSRNVLRNQLSSDKHDENKYRGGKNYLSSLVYCFSFGCILLLVIQSQRFRRNEISIARN